MNTRRLLLCTLLALTRAASADDSLEPPPEAPEGDYALEARDSLERGAMELGVGAGGRVGGSSRSVRRLRFHGEGMTGSLREGDDPLKGGRVEAGAAGGTLRVGRLAPRWGRGLLLGGAADPWAREASDRGDVARFVGRAGEGASWRRAGGLQAEALTGRFARRRIAGARASCRAVGLAFLARPGGGSQGSLAIGGGAEAMELAVDARGRWRAEGALASRDEQGVMAIALRAGHDGFRSLAEPLRSGPARSVATWMRRRAGGAQWSLAAAAWSFRAGEAGARAALEGTRALGGDARVLVGLEEQRGPRRVGQPSHGPRRGVHGELRATAPGGVIVLRDEWWGERPWARDAVRRVMAVRSEIVLPQAAMLTVVHAVWRAESGERLWLADATRDGLVLRSALGAGERTRLELTLPVSGGLVRLGATLERRERLARAPTWTAEWTRRGKL